MKRFITYLLCCMALAIISLSLNSCKYHGRNEDIPDMHGEEIIESLAADKEVKKSKKLLKWVESGEYDRIINEYRAVECTHCGGEIHAKSIICPICGGKYQ